VKKTKWLIGNNLIMAEELLEESNDAGYFKSNRV
jgi:hypothetical protein